MKRIYKGADLRFNLTVNDLPINLNMVEKITFKFYTINDSNFISKCETDVDELNQILLEWKELSKLEEGILYYDYNISLAKPELTDGTLDSVTKIMTDYFIVTGIRDIDVEDQKIKWGNVIGDIKDQKDLVSYIDLKITQIDYSNYYTKDDIDGMGYLTEHQDISGKQDKLVSGSNIKTINGNPILGSGDIQIKAEGVGKSGTGMHSEIFNDYENNTALNQYSHAEGQSTNAEGIASHAEGKWTTAGGENSHAEGRLTDAKGSYSHAEGRLTSAWGIHSHVEGYEAKAEGDNSHAEGWNTKSNGKNSHAEGAETKSPNFAQHASGSYNTEEENPSPLEFNKEKTLFVIGNGTGNKDRSDAFKMLGNGTTWIAGIGDFNGKNPTTENSLQAVIANAGSSYTLPIATVDTLGGVQPVTKTDEMSQEVGVDATGKLFTKAGGSAGGGVGKPGTGECAEVFNEGDPSNAGGNWSHAEGSNTTASGKYSHAEGSQTTASGDLGSHAEGWTSTAKGWSSHAEGQATANGRASHAESWSTANGEGSHAEGRSTANGVGSHAEGNETTASNFAQHASGSYNTDEVDPSPTTFNAEKTLFVIGNGYWDSSARLAVKSDAFKVLGNGETYAAGKLLNPAADYAEMFEWLDSNPNNEDRVGYFVELINDKIQIANSNSKDIIGIISGNPAVVGDSPQFWHNKYMTDEWGRVLYEDVEVEYDDRDEEGKPIKKTRIDHIMKLNPNYDPTIPYIDRRNRKEWDVVGLFGKLLVRQDGSLTAGDYCRSNDLGKATKSVNGYKVMKVINKDQVLILFK